MATDFLKDAPWLENDSNVPVVDPGAVNVERMRNRSSYC